MALDLTASLQAAAGSKQPQQPKAEKVATTQPSETKRVSNRSITCSQELRDRLRIMAATKGIPMQTIIEDSLTKTLEEAGF